jgi:hypothetical protein
VLLVVVVVEVVDVDVCAKQIVATATKEKALIINNLVFISVQFDKVAPDTREFICRFQLNIARIRSDRP